MLSELKQRLRLWVRYQTEVGGRSGEILELLHQQQDRLDAEMRAGLERSTELARVSGQQADAIARQLEEMAGELAVNNALLANNRLNGRIGLRRAIAADALPTAIPLPVNTGLSEIEIAAGQPDHGRALFDLLRRKWNEVPGGLMDRVETDALLGLNARELRDYWRGVWSEASLGPAHAVRGWYHGLYAEAFRGKRVLEIGSGMGIDGLHFIKAGARWHFADIVQSNLDLIARELDAFGLSCEGFTWLQDFSSFDALPDGFDFIYAQGSLINLPFPLAREETLRLLAHLRPGGRWVELCYPKERWLREGALPFAQWGAKTDGERTPWMEWYDLARLRQRFDPVPVRDLLAFNFHHDDFNWFDLAIDRIPTPAALHAACHQPPAEIDPTWPELCQYAESVSLTGLVWRHRALLAADPGGAAALAPVPCPVFVPVVDPVALDAEMGWRPDGWLDEFDRAKGYLTRKMETDDAVILAHLYRAARPMRHLEFGTWEGFGASLCAANCDAEIWTLNLAQGEPRADGGPAYSMVRDAAEVARIGDATPVLIDDNGQPIYQTDAGAFIGWRYRAAGYAGRVHQILVDSTQWDSTDLASASFDTVLVDGGHDMAAVVSDTNHALRLLRPGGLMIWHDFCPSDSVMAYAGATRGVVAALHAHWADWSPRFDKLFWIRDSYILLGQLAS